MEQAKRSVKYRIESVEDVATFPHNPFLLLRMFLELVDLGSDAVHVTTTLRRQFTSTIGVLLDQRHLFQRLCGEQEMRYH